MILKDVPLFDMLKGRMRWHEERQRVLAENIANADTPDFRPSDLAPFQAARGGQFGALLATTDAAHIAGRAAKAGRFGEVRRAAFEVRPSGNAVELEEEMLKVGQNQMDHQAAASLYQRSLGLLKTAIGRR